MSNRKDEGIGFALGLMIGAVFAAWFIFFTIDITRDSVWQKDAIRFGIGEYNPQTAKFQFVSPKAIAERKHILDKQIAHKNKMDEINRIHREQIRNQNVTR